MLLAVLLPDHHPTASNVDECVGTSDRSNTANFITSKGVLRRNRYSISGSSEYRTWSSMGMGMGGAFPAMWSGCVHMGPASRTILYCHHQGPGLPRGRTGSIWIAASTNLNVREIVAIYGRGIQDVSCSPHSALHGERYPNINGNSCFPANPYFGSIVLWMLRIIWPSWQVAFKGKERKKKKLKTSPFILNILINYKI